MLHLPMNLYDGHILSTDLHDKHKKGNGKSHIRSVRREVPVREDTCPGPSAL